MNLHNEIMNIPAKEFEATPKHYGEYSLVYKLGHLDARHAAAELSLAATAQMEDLQEALKRLYKNGLKQGWVDNYESDMAYAKSVLERM